jgi:hypothetical protein
MYRSKILNRIKLYCFLKFVVLELNFEMVSLEWWYWLEERKLMLMDCRLEAAACYWNNLRGWHCCPWSAPAGVTAPVTCRSLAWWNPVWRCFPISGEISPDQVENWSQDCVGKRLCYSYRVLVLLLLLSSSMIFLQPSLRRLERW